MPDAGNPITSLKVRKSHDLRDIPRETGTYRREVEDDIVHTFTIKDRKIVKHEATDRNGKSLATSRIRVAVWPHIGGTPPAPDHDVHYCYICTSDGDTWGGGE